MEDRILFDEVIGGYKMVIKIEGRLVKIFDYLNNFRAEMPMATVPEFMCKIRKYSGVITDYDDYPIQEDTILTSVLDTRGLNIRGTFKGNWVKTSRIPYILSVLNGLYKEKITTKKRTRGQLNRCKISTLISIAKDIDIAKELNSIT